MKTKIKTFEDALQALNIPQAPVGELPNVPEKHRKAMVAIYKLILIVEAINEGWTPDWNNSNQRKYEFWPDIVQDTTKPNGFGLSYYDVGDWATFTNVGSRLCFESREKAKYCFETFKDLLEDWLLP